MQESGWTKTAADEVVTALENNQAPGQSDSDQKSLKPYPWIAEGHLDQEIDLGGHKTRILARLKLPKLILFENLLTDNECDALIELARPAVAQSLVVDEETGHQKSHLSRTSHGHGFSRGEMPLLEKIERRIARLFNWPYECAEGLVLLRYQKAEQYLPHFDYFDTQKTSSHTYTGRGGQRIGTLIIYLSTPEQGGATIFPDVGFEVEAIKGHAVFFVYERANPDTKTLHGGAPVLAGEKWIATKWFRETAY